MDRRGTAGTRGRPEGRAREFSRRLTGLQAPALGTSVSALLYLPVATVLFARTELSGPAVWYAVAAGVLSIIIAVNAASVGLDRPERPAITRVRADAARPLAPARAR